MRYEKWIGYEFASDIKQEDIPMIKFENGLTEGTTSGYLENIYKTRTGFIQYIILLRYKNSNFENEEKEIRFAYKAFKKYFYDRTVLPR